MRFLRVILSILLAPSVALALGCDKPKVLPGVQCTDFEPRPASRLTLEGARAAFLHAETLRNIRYQEALSPGYFLRTTKLIASQSKIDRGQVCYEQLYNIGRLLFEHEYSFADGLGREDARTREDPFRKVHDGQLGGPETNSCTSCHWRGGLAGGGSVLDNSQIHGDGINISSADARNPPALIGSGVVQALAQEMSQELQAQRDAAMESARSSDKSVEVSLLAKGIKFGTLYVSADGVVDNSGILGVDEDLVIRPFGWRGEFATLRDFVMASTQVHLGIQSEDLLSLPEKRSIRRGDGPKNDRDNDGIVGELGAGQLTSLIIYLASLELPVISVPEVLHGLAPASPGVRAPSTRDFYEEFSDGRRIFDDLGCTTCHTPMLVLHDPIFRTKSEVSGKTYEIDLSKQVEKPRLQYDEALGGYPVYLFSDMRRHDLGRGVAAKHPMPGQPAGEYLTRRLWGLAASPPYFYDGRAPRIDDAILAHGGDAAFAVESFEELSGAQRASLRIYLLSLRRSPEFVVH